MKLKKYFKHTGLNTYNVLGSFCLSFFLAYSISSFSEESSTVTSKYFIEYLHIIENIKIFLETINVKFITSNLLLLTIVLFLIHIFIFRNEKIKFTKNKKIIFIDQLVQKLSLLVPIKQFITFIFFVHFNSIDASEKIFSEDFSTFILLASFISSTIIIVGIPFLVNTVNGWRLNSAFAKNSGLIFHFKSIEELSMDLSFKKYLESINDIKVVKILGVTLKNTFVSEESYIYELMNNLKNTNKPQIKLLYSKENSIGLTTRAKNIGLKVEILNQEIAETKAYIKNHKVLEKYTVSKQYTHEPKYKLIIIEGNEKIILLQAYLDKKNILEEEVYIYKDSSSSTIYKILNDQYDDLYNMYHKISSADNN